MSFLSLSTELIEKIASYLGAQDIAVLTLCCKRFHHIVEGSLLLHYLCQTSLAGVDDPLYDLPTLSIVDRLETLERWEASWNDIGRYLTAPRLVVPAERDLFGPFFLCDDYLFAVDWQGHPTGLRQPALLYVDLRDALRTGQHTWKQIDYPPGSIAITQAFSIEQDDLVVSVLSLRRQDGSPTATVLRFMSLETGGVHPLAKEPDLPLDTQLPVNLLDVRADIIGDHIVLVLVDLRPNNPESDAIYLVDWKQGLMTLVHRAPNGTYEGALAVLSPDLVLFLKRKTPSIELCRVTRGGGWGTDGAAGQSPPSLHVVCTLALPAFHPDCRVHTAYMQTDRHCERRPRTTSSAAAIQRRQRHQEQDQDQEQGEEQPAPLPFHSAPEDMVVGITFLLRERGPRAVWKKVVTTISHRALFALASTFDDPLPQNDNEGVEGDDDDDSDGEDAEEEEEEGEVEEEEEEEVPWEEWGRSAARVIAPPSFQWITAYAGQRWLSLESDNKLVVRDFSAARVRRAIARARARRRTSAELRGGDNYYNDNGYGYGHGHRRRHSSARGWGSGWSSGCFAEEVVSELPFLETRVDAPGLAGAMVLTDGERLVAFVRAGQPPTFDIHVLDDGEERHFSSSAAGPRGSSRNQPRMYGDMAVPGSSYQLA